MLILRICGATLLLTALGAFVFTVYVVAHMRYPDEWFFVVLGVLMSLLYGWGGLMYWIAGSK